MNEEEFAPPRSLWKEHGKLNPNILHSYEDAKDQNYPSYFEDKMAGLLQPYYKAVISKAA
jgi:hypothetical protein